MFFYYQVTHRIFSGPSSNDDYLGHSKNHDWLIEKQSAKQRNIKQAQAS